MIDWTTVILAVLGSSVVNTIIAAIIRHIETKKNRKDAYATAIRLLLYSRLRHDAKEYMGDGTIAKTEYDAFMESYDAYKALGGDGYMDKIKKEVESLPVILTE